MKKRQVGLMVVGFLLFVLVSFGQSWAQNPTTLIVVRGMDDSLWKMTCDEAACSPFSRFPGLLAYPPTVTWDEATQEWVVVGTAAGGSIWMGTFDRQGNFNNDWQPLPGLTPSPAGVSSSLYKMGGDIKTDRWLNSDSNTFIGVGVVGAGSLTHTGLEEGWYNTAFGYRSLYFNATGQDNTAIGYETLRDNTEGVENTAIGSEALRDNTTSAHTAIGFGALRLNTTGEGNTANGYGALAQNTDGSYNTAIGFLAGYNATTGSNNIFIGNQVLGSAGESDVIRIGNGQTTTYIAGINGASIGAGSVVYVNGAGQLGTAASSRRFKENIKDMGEASSRLMNLRPVMFRYKNEVDQEDRRLQYGLIAEEVAEVYPELVQYEKDGQPFTVRYHELSPMLLNEAQKQYQHIQKQDEQIKQLTHTMNELTQALNEKDTRIQRLEKLLEGVQERMALIESPTITIVSK